MIEIVARSGPPEAMTCPAFICDACRQQVVGRGNIYWVVKVAGEHWESSPVFVGHKGKCGKAVEALVGVAYPPAVGWCSPLWNELATFVKHLTFNSANPFTEDSEGEYHDHKLIQADGCQLPTFVDVPSTRRQPRAEDD